MILGGSKTELEAEWEADLPTRRGKFLQPVCDARFMPSRMMPSVLSKLTFDIDSIQRDEREKRAAEQWEHFAIRRTLYHVDPPQQGDGWQAEQHEHQAFHGYVREIPTRWDCCVGPQ